MLTAAYVPQPAPPSAQSPQLQAFWQQQMHEVQQVGTDPVDFKNQQLPLARIKKVCSTLWHLRAAACSA